MFSRPARHANGGRRPGSTEGASTSLATGTDARLRGAHQSLGDTEVCEVHRKHSVHQLTQQKDGRICAVGGGAFSPEGYSLFKHGDERWARRFGHEIADLLMDAEAPLLDHARPDEVLIAAFPYKYIPTATAVMVEHTVTRLNHLLSAKGRPAVGRLHAFKYPWRASVEHNFPGMGEEARRRVLDNVELSVDEYRLRGTHLIIVDDVRVTGASQDRFLRLLHQVRGLSSLSVVFLCEIDPAIAAADPAIERRLNYYKVTTLGDVADIAATGEFRWNIRVAKFVLEEQDREAFDDFVGGLKDSLLLELYRSVVLNDYHLERKYEPRIRIVRSATEARGLV